MSIIIGVFSLLAILLRLYTYVILGYCLLSMVLGFNILNLATNRIAIAIFEVLARLVEPALNPIRRVLNALLPQMGMMDFSPLILLLAVQYLAPYALRTLFKTLYALHGVA